VRDEEIEKKEKEENLTVANLVFAETTMSSNQNGILRGGWSSGGSSKFRISPKSVKRFRGCGVEVEKFALSD